MSMSVIFSCVLLVVGVTLAETSCSSKTYTLSTPSTCSVNEEITFDFEYTPPADTCDDKSTICLAITNTGTTLSFTGTFTETTLKITSTTTKTAQLPVLLVTDKTSFATPEVGVLPSDIATALLPNSKAITFVLPDGDWSTTAPKGCEKQSSLIDTNPCDTKLCCLFESTSMKIWGKDTASTTKIILTKQGSADETTVIPLIIGTPTDEMTTPSLLKVPSDGKLPSPVQIVVPFVVTTVSGASHQTSSSNCDTSKTACYTTIKAPNKATFKGVMPNAPVTFTIEHGQSTISYSFSRAGTMLQSSLTAFMMASTVLIVSRF